MVEMCQKPAREQGLAWKELELLHRRDLRRLDSLRYISHTTVPSGTKPFLGTMIMRSRM